MKQDLSYVAALRLVDAAWFVSSEGASMGDHEIAMKEMRKIAQQLDADDLRLALDHAVELAAKAIDNAQKQLASRAEGWFV